MRNSSVGMNYKLIACYLSTAGLSNTGPEGHIWLRNAALQALCWTSLILQHLFSGIPTLMAEQWTTAKTFHQCTGQKLSTTDNFLAINLITNIQPMLGLHHKQALVGANQSSDIMLISLMGNSLEEGTCALQPLQTLHSFSS